MRDLTETEGLFLFVGVIIVAAAGVLYCALKAANDWLTKNDAKEINK
jgi:hypothetical protein